LISASQDIIGVIKSVAKEARQKVSSAKTPNLSVRALAEYCHLLLKAALQSGRFKICLVTNKSVLRKYQHDRNPCIQSVICIQK